MIQFDTEKAESITDPPADEWRVFADAGREHQRIQAAQRSGIGANPFLDLVAEQLYGFRGPDIGRFTRAQIADVGTGPETPRNPESWFTIF